MKRWQGGFVAVAAFALCIAILLLSLGSGVISGEKIRSAPEFSLVDHEGAVWNLTEQRGKVVLLHFTQLEYPLCLECEAAIVAQLRQLQALANQSVADLTILTINLRKNAYSDPGWQIAERDYGINVTWAWAEEMQPYAMANEYLEYWQVQGGLSNPALLLIDEQGRAVGVYHVYIVGRGNADGVRSAPTLAADVQKIAAGQWGDTLVGYTSKTEVSAIGMFALGVLTSFSPCSIALLMTMVLYIGARTSKKGKDGDLKTGLGIGLTFTLGIATVFLLLGLLLGYLGGFLTMSTAFYLLAGGVLVLLGVNAIFPLRRTFARLRGREEGCACETPRGPFGSMGTRMLDRLRSRSHLLAGFALGALFSLGWAPCALSLVFPMLLLMLAQGLGALQTGLLLFVFGLGHGLIIVPLCAASGELRERLLGKYEQAARPIMWAFGAAIIAMGLLFAARSFGVLLW
jgi:cytochrome c-type biogenesis protein